MSVRVLVAMSGGVDSSVAAALLQGDGHDVEGATMKLWAGPSDSGCCSVADVEDARRVAQQLGVRHHVFNFSAEFDRHVVGPYVDAHAAGRTPNPCVECNRHLKLDRLVRRADQLGFDAVATGHHAKVVRAGGRHHLRRGADAAKDQSYVLHMLTQDLLARVLLPVGHLTKSEVRDLAASLALRTAAKPDSQDVCFITSTGGRRRFLAERLQLHPAEVVDEPTGRVLGTVDAVELVTVGQRRGLGLSAGDGRPRFVVRVDVPGRRVHVAAEPDPRPERVVLDPDRTSWVDEAPEPGAAVLAQTSAHGPARPATWDGAGVVWAGPERPVAPGQAVVLYDPADADECLGGGPAA